MNKIPKLIFNNEILDRRADLRNHKCAKSYLSCKEALNIVFFNELPLISSNGNHTRLTYLLHDHWLLKFVNLSVFLGLYRGKSVYAHNISTDQLGLRKQAPTEYLKNELQKDPLMTNTDFKDLRTNLTIMPEDDSNLAGTGRNLIQWNLNNRFCGKCGLSLSLKNFGWEARCEKCNRSYFPRTDPVVIILITSGNKTLLGRSNQFPEKLYSCLAGFIEPGETIEMAARREVQEEVGIKIHDIEYIANQPWPFPSSLMIGLRARTNQETLDIDKNELEDALWVTKKELKNVLNGDCDSILPARTGTIARHLLESWALGEI